MVQNKRFCTNCGAPLTAGDKFCGSCGHPLVIPPIESPAIVPASEKSAETLIGIIPAVSRKKGLLGAESFNIVVTEKRMIFAEMTGDMVKEEAKKYGQEGFLTGMLGAMTVGYTLHKRYLNMSPEDALHENPGNFFIDLNRIKKVRIEEGKRQREKSRGNETHENSRIEIETIGEKYTFNLPFNFHSTAQEVVRKAGLF